MSPAPKSKILLILIGILLVTNIILVGLVVLKPNQRKGIRGDKFGMISSFLQNEMAFNKEQLQQYDSLNRRHRLQMKVVFDSMRKDKELQFKKLTAENFSDSAINTTADISGKKQKAVELVMFNYFKNIRNLCSPQQLPKFDSMFYKTLNKRNEEMKK